jgi:hypothetical protein
MMTSSNEEKGYFKDEETRLFILKLAQMIDPPPLSEEFNERLRQRLKHISSGEEESAQEKEKQTEKEKDHFRRMLVTVHQIRQMISLSEQDNARIQPSILSEHFYELLTKVAMLGYLQQQEIMDEKNIDINLSTNIKSSNQLDNNDGATIVINIDGESHTYYIHKDTIEVIVSLINELNGKIKL